jgi:GGDEF domain-containing protein
MAILLPFTQEEKAHAVLDRLRGEMTQSVSEALTDMGLAIKEPVSMSVGVAEVEFTGDPHEKLEASVVTKLIKKADERMYLAKIAGKNRVISSKNLPPHK